MWFVACSDNLLECKGKKLKKKKPSDRIVSKLRFEAGTPEYEAHMTYGSIL